MNLVPRVERVGGRLPTDLAISYMLDSMKYNRPSTPRKLDASDLGLFPHYLGFGLPYVDIWLTLDQCIQIRSRSIPRIEILKIW